MNNALFTYRRAVKSADNSVKYNDNYVNPLCVISFFWQENEEGKQILSVFLANNYTLTFGETTGARFVEHMEAFLRFQLGWGRAETKRENSKPAERHIRRAIPTEDIVEESAQPAAWE